MRIAAMTVLVMLCSVVPGLGQATKEIEQHWSPLGLQVEKAGPPGASRQSDYGTSVKALLHLPGKFMVGLDFMESKVQSFSDDKNTDLLKNPQPQWLTSSDFGQARLSPDGRYCSITFRSPGWPAAGATKVRLRGGVVVLVGKDEKQFEQKDASLRLGIDLKFGTLKQEERSRDLGFLANAITYRGSRPLKQVTFLTEDGKEIEYEQSGRMLLPGLDGDKQFSATYRPKSRIERCTVRVTYFDTIERVVVPLDLEFGVGLSVKP